MRNLDLIPENIRKFIEITPHHWIWVGAISDEKRKHKQPVARFNGITKKVHRVMMHLFENFDLDSPLQVNHKPDCNFDICVNPDHLYIGTQKQNMEDTITAGTRTRKTHCIYGHELSVSPTTGQQYCVTCKNERRKEWRKNKKA